MASALLAHVSASLDAVSYIVAMGAVDLMTFGRPVHPTIAESEKYGLTSSARANGKLTPRRTSSDPGNGLGSSSPRSDTPHLDSRTSPWQRRTGSIDDYLLPRAPSEHAHHKQRSGSDSSAGDGGVHHHQGKLFSKQMNRAVRLQPYIKASLVASALTLMALVASFTGLLLLNGTIVPALERIASTALVLWSQFYALLASVMPLIYPTRLQV